jgi:two-component SAPR family response regulator
MSPAKLRCVVVDDDCDFLEQVKRWFLRSCADFEVLPFANSVDALDYLRRERVDLIVTA